VWTSQLFYCYGRLHALRYGIIKRPEDWAIENVSANKIIKRFGKRRGIIMYPTMHDIVPGPYLEGSVVVLRSMLEAGNEVLVVSKPHLKCIVRICEELREFKNRVMFRFTIGSSDDIDLAFWEPGAPSFEERIAALKHANEKVFRTSVSMEPLLCGIGVAIDLVARLSGMVSDTIWLGLMNKARERTAWIKEDDPRRPELERRLNWIEQVSHPENVRRLYGSLKDNPKIRWKDSIKAILNLTAQV
jgi:DNA repair photolyase